MARKPDIDTSDKKGNSILHLACEAPEVNVLIYLLQNKVFSSVPKNNKGQSPLHHACELQNVKAVKALLRYFFPLNPADEEGNTPLLTAIHANNTEICKLLIDTAYPDGNRTDIMRADKNGNTPLHMSSIKDNVEVAKMLLEKGGNRFLKNKEGLTPVTIILEEERLMSQVYWQCYATPSPLGDIAAYIDELFPLDPAADITFLE